MPITSTTIAQVVATRVPSNHTRATTLNLTRLVLVLLSTLLIALTSHADVEELLVETKFPCGPWPVEHAGALECYYPRIEPDAFKAIMGLRGALHNACLECDKVALNCRQRHFSRTQKEDARICKSVFLTPKYIPNLIAVASLAKSSIDVDVTFDVTQEGLVDGVKVTNVDGSENKAMRRLVTKASKKVRYEPLLIENQAYRIVDLQGSYTFE